MFDAEYVNIFGVPFIFLPHESDENVAPKPTSPKTAIEPVPAKAAFEIKWPNIIRIEHVYRPRLSLDWNRAEPLEINASETAQVAELAPIVDGKPNVSKVSDTPICESALPTWLEWTQIDRPRVPEFSVAIESVE